MVEIDMTKSSNIRYRGCINKALREARGKNIRIKVLYEGTVITKLWFRLCSKENRNDNNVEENTENGEAYEMKRKEREEEKEKESED